MPAVRYPFPDLNSLPADIRERILQVQDKAGFIPNVFLALARRPAEWRAFFAYHDALMLKEEGSLTKGEREMIVTATSAANQCLYCVVAHGAILRIRAKDPLLADQIAAAMREGGFVADLAHDGDGARESAEAACGVLEVHARPPLLVEQLVEPHPVLRHARQCPPPA